MRRVISTGSSRRSRCARLLSTSRTGMTTTAVLRGRRLRRRNNERRNRQSQWSSDAPPSSSEGGGHRGRRAGAWPRLSRKRRPASPPLCCLRRRASSAAAPSPSPAATAARAHDLPLGPRVQLPAAQGKRCRATSRDGVRITGRLGPLRRAASRRTAHRKARLRESNSGPRVGRRLPGGPLEGRLGRDKPRLLAEVGFSVAWCIGISSLNN